MFAPVVKATHLALSRRRRRERRRRGGPRRDHRARAPGLPGGRHRPARAPRSPGRRLARRAAPDVSPRRPDLAAAIARARRRRAPAVVGRRRRARRGDGGRGARRATRRAGAHHLRRGGRPRPRAIRACVGLPPHVEAAGRLWDEADVVLAIGSDLDGVQTQNFAQPQPDTLIAISLEPLVNYRVDVLLEGDAGDVTAALADARARPRRARAAGGASGRRARRGLRRRSTPPRCASSTRSTSPFPPTA